MINAKDVTAKQFDKATFGYKPEDVDDFLREVAMTISQLQKDKEETEKKMEVLVDKVREYKNDEEALKKLDELGIPRNLLPKFGFTMSDDFSSTYTLKKSKAPRKPKKPSVTILPAKFKGTFDDGNGDFNIGDIIKIHMRAEFVSDKHGVKKFRNLYFKPTIEELEAYRREHAAS